MAGGSDGNRRGFRGKRIVKSVFISISPEPGQIKKLITTKYSLSVSSRGLFHYFLLKPTLEILEQLLTEADKHGPTLEFPNVINEA